MSESETLDTAPVAACKVWWDGQWCLFTNPVDLLDEIRTFEDDDEIRLELVVMTRAEIKALPEFEGWS